MGKNKLAKWKELATFENVIQPMTGELNHPVRGNWRKEIFRNENPVVLELACGRGEYTTGLSGIYPDRNFIGVDIKGARMWKGARTASDHGLPNVAFLRTRIEFIDSYFSENEVDEIWLVFPDPHTGEKNSNKRLTCPWFLNKYRSFMKNKGTVHLKTDDPELLSFTERVVTQNKLDLLLSVNDLYASYINDKNPFKRAWAGSTDTRISDETADRIIGIKTHYEEMFLKQGLKINYLAFRLEKEKHISYNPEERNR